MTGNRTAASSCEGKKKFASYESARRNGMGSDKMRALPARVYRCPHCRCFHIGVRSVANPERRRSVLPEEKFVHENEFDRRKR